MLTGCPGPAGIFPLLFGGPNKAPALGQQRERVQLIMELGCFPAVHRHHRRIRTPYFCEVAVRGGRGGGGPYIGGRADEAVAESQVGAGKDKLHPVELAEVTWQRPVHRRTRTAVDFDVQQPGRRVGSEVRIGNEEVMQEAACRGAFSERPAQQAAKGRLRPGRRSYPPRP